MPFQGPLLFYIWMIIIVVCVKDSLVNAQLNNTDVGRPKPRTTTRPSTSEFAWSSWGAWSRCSKTCGGGVSVQERHCLPRDPARFRRSRRKRKQASNRTRRGVDSVPDCPGLARRYHECNTEPCPGEARDSRSEQCAVYDRRPFKGRFYTWVPYVDGNSPCTLNCRPRGQQFYASLALVTDGTPCTKPGYRAICVHGSCKIVGREGVLASSVVREPRCGRRLVSGLFARPRLPLGYSYVATVPRGACRLNVTELAPTDNYIALKLTNGSYIMNGEFAVSAQGTYEAAGARFVYTRNAGQDVVYAQGPLHRPVDIMILFTQSDPTIKYEYYTDSGPEDTSNDIPKSSTPQHSTHTPHHHRHHVAESQTRALDKPDPHEISNTISSRKFVWRILAFTQCSRTCGGGLQIGKFKCVEVTGKEDREVAPIHCTGSPPSSRRRRCGAVPCPPRWRAAAWGPCPVCGPAHRTRIVGCVQDHSRGITKISDQKCPLPMPPNSELCSIPNCDGTIVSATPRTESRRQTSLLDRIDHFQDGPVVSLASNTSENEIKPSLSYSFSAGGGWLFTEWSECVGWCVGGGVQTRGVRCADPNGCKTQAPVSSQPCHIKKACDMMWFTTDWSPCSASCDGRQVRAALCLTNTGRRLRDSACRESKPPTERSCGGNCPPSWYLSDWGECKGPCEAAVQTRTVWCARDGVDGARGAAKDSECASLRPVPKRSCVPPRCTSRPAKPSANHTRELIPNTDLQQRVTRHPNHHQATGKASDAPCIDKLSNCALAVQARLCNYPYYTQYCCQSCHGRGR